MFTDYAYFRLFFTYFPPVVPHPYYKLKHMLPICRFSAHMFTDFAYFPPIFRLKFPLFSARPVLPGTVEHGERRTEWGLGTGR